MAVKGRVEGEASTQDQEKIRLTGEAACDPVAARSTLSREQRMPVGHDIGMAGGRNHGDPQRLRQLLQRLCRDRPLEAAARDDDRRARRLDHRGDRGNVIR